MSVRVRFAPSPTGFLHVGGARTALYNYLHARRHGGVFVLRIEDTDAARSTDESVEAIFDSMRWLGLTWDEGPGVGGKHGPYFQSQRREHYAKHSQSLIESGLAYPCVCSAEELERRRREEQAHRGEATGYDGRCRALSPAEREKIITEGRPAALRFALDSKGETSWDDVVRERVAFQNAVLDDFVIVRSDGLPTYNYACVVDDHEMEITEVIRGDDHISNTPRQLLLYRAFGWEPPRFAHVPMILGSDGTRLSKRHGATSVSAYRDLGYLPQALVNFLALLGWSFDGKREMFTLGDLEELFRLERVGANPAIFDSQKLEWMNAQYLKLLPEAERVGLVTGFMATRGIDLSGRDPQWLLAMVRAMGERLKTLADAEDCGRFALQSELEMEPDAWSEVAAKGDAGIKLEHLARRLEADTEFTLESLERETRSLAGDLGLKAGELIGLARVALTGRKASPGIFEVMWLLGKERAVERLRLAARRWHEESPRASV